ncbi:hypothetical protein AAC387_Pa11g1077 [Persea americana]
MVFVLFSSEIIVRWKETGISPTTKWRWHEASKITISRTAPVGHLECNAARRAHSDIVRLLQHPTATGRSTSSSSSSAAAPARIMHT